MTIHKAVKQLREALGQSQQVFATELGMSISSLVNYERDRKPAAKQLAAFERAARKTKRADLAQLFHEALEKELGCLELR